MGQAAHLCAECKADVREQVSGGLGMFEGLLLSSTFW